MLLSTIADADELETIIDVVFLYLDMGYPEAAKEWLDKGKSRYAKMKNIWLSQPIIWHRPIR